MKYLFTAQWVKRCEEYTLLSITKKLSAFDLTPEISVEIQNLAVNFFRTSLLFSIFHSIQRVDLI